MRVGRDREVWVQANTRFPRSTPFVTSALAIEPSIYLDALVRDFMLFGGKIVIRKFDTPRDLMSLNEPVIINCTGLGSKTLFNDGGLLPIRGQLTVCIPQPEVRYRASGRLPEQHDRRQHQPAKRRACHWQRAGTPGTGQLERANEEVRQQNMSAAIAFFAAMRAPTGGVRLARSERARATPSLESFYGEES